MNIVINPSGTAGFSFKGLHAYCAHDKDGPTSERVTWISTHNLAASPRHAYKVMVATAQAQNELKRNAGVRVGRPTEKGEVMHIIMAYDKDEPKDQATREAAARELLGCLGRDPKSRGGKGASVRQFADEHQAVFYAHEDTENDHVHIMLNTVHPGHGRRLPTSNDQLKASRWALGFSKKHGTAHKTPAREENMAARDRGEYVKAERRKSRNVFEEEQGLRSASNDNDRVKAFLANQKRKDAALYARGRTLADKQQARSQAIETRFEERKMQADEVMKREINRSKSAIREAFRPQFRDLQSRQNAERKTFEALEKSFFGRTKNALKAVRSAFDKQDQSLLSRSFRVLSSAGERRAFFDRGQLRERTALEKSQSEQIDDAVRKAEQFKAESYKDARSRFASECEQAQSLSDGENQDYRAAWRARRSEREADIQDFKTIERAKPAMGGDFTRAKLSDDYFRDLERRAGLSDGFDRAGQTPAQEQDNERDDGQDRD